LTFLLDANVISALAPTRPERPASLVDWLDRNSGRLFLSVVTATEIRAGIAKAAREGATRKAESLSNWWNAVEYFYGERILPFDLKAAALAGAMADRARGLGQAPGFADIAIAATADANELVLLTRNRKHFDPLYNRVVDPFETPPAI
jgi:predicted nucleic acid-binding protein